MGDETTEATVTPVEQGVTDTGAEGAQTPSAQTEAPKTFTQDEVNKLVQARLAEHGRTLKTKHEKELETKLAETRAETQADLDKLVDERVAARLAEQELTTARAGLMAELGLSEEQAARLQGTTPAELTKDAELIYGALKQLPKPPIIKTGEGAAVPQSPTDLSRMTPAEIRANAPALWKAAR